MFKPYRVKVVEPIKIVPQTKRAKILMQAGYNPFHIPADSVSIDLISDSGTGAMSAQQWAGIVQSREDFSGQQSYRNFVKTAQEIFGFPYVQPVHQGRTAENLLFKLVLKPGDCVLSNTHFETTRENIEVLGGKAIDIVKPDAPFCGNIDCVKLEKYLNRSKNVKMVILTITNNIHGGQPVSLDNIEKARKLTKKKKVLLVFDASRFAGNAYLIRKYARSRISIKAMCRDIFKSGDICYMSCKKDGLSNIGGFIGVREKQLFERLQFHVITQESYPTSGGLAARDLTAMTLGLREAIKEDFLRSYISDLHYLAGILKMYDVKIFEPVGGHGIVIFPRSRQKYGAFSLAADVYLATGIRGGVFEKDFRLALPRRVYTRNHLDYIAESISLVYHKKPMRLACVYRPRKFFNFFARFKKAKR